MNIHNERISTYMYYVESTETKLTTELEGEENVISKQIKNGYFNMYVFCCSSISNKYREITNNPCSSQTPYVSNQA